MVDTKNGPSDESASYSFAPKESPILSYFRRNPHLRKVYFIGEPKLMESLASIGVEAVVYEESKLSFDEYDTYQLDQTI